MNESYAPIRSLQVQGTTLDSIQGVPIPSQNIPFKEGHIDAFSMISVPQNTPDELISHTDRLVKVSSIHGRSYEIRFNEAGKIYFSDEYGNMFSTLTTKGNNLENPKAYVSDNAPSGFLFYGLQDSDAIVRVLKASDILRSINVESEMLIKIIEPSELLINGELVPLEGFKRQLVENIWQENAEVNSIANDIGLQNISRQELPKFISAMDKMTFFITVRGLQVSERLKDLSKASSPEEFQVIMKRVFEFINKNEAIHAKKEQSSEPKVLQSENEQDIENYFLTYLPKKIARNMAKMHEGGLIHFFPHNGNISAVGSVYDLDSVKGMPLGLGDREIDIEDTTSDIKMLLYGQGIVGDGALSVIREVHEKQFLVGNENPVQTFEEVFFKEYIHARGWDNDVIGNLSKIYDTFGKLLTSQFPETLLENYIGEIAEKLGWEYTFPDLSQYNEVYKQLEYKRLDERFAEIKDNKWGESFRKKSEENSLDNASKIAKHRQNNQTFQILEADLRANHQKELNDVTAEYGQEFCDILVTILIENYAPAATDFLVQYGLDDIEEMDYLKTLIKQNGWEDDLIPNLQNIYELFDGFTDMNIDTYPKAQNHKMEILEHYLQILRESTGLEFPFRDTDVEKVFEEYLEQYRLEIEALFEKAVNEADPAEDRNQVLINAYIDAGYNQNNAFNLEYWEVFLSEYLDKMMSLEEMDKKVDEHLNKINMPEKQQDNVRGEIYGFLIARPQRMVQQRLNLEEMAQLENQVESLVFAIFLHGQS